MKKAPLDYTACKAAVCQRALMCRGDSGIEFSEYGLLLYAAYDAEIGDSCKLKPFAEDE